MIICNQGYMCPRNGGAQFAWVTANSCHHINYLWFFGCIYIFVLWPVWLALLLVQNNNSRSQLDLVKLFINHLCSVYISSLKTEFTRLSLKNNFTLLKYTLLFSCNPHLIVQTYEKKTNMTI